MAENEGIQIKEILAKADGGCPRSEDFEAAYNGYVFGPDGRVKERPYVYMSEKLRSTTFNHLHWSVSLHMSPYLIFVISFTQAKFSENEIYTEKRVNYKKRISRENSVNQNLLGQAMKKVS